MSPTSYTLTFIDKGNTVIAEFDSGTIEGKESESSLSVLYIITILEMIKSGEMDKRVETFLEKNFG